MYLVLTAENNQMLMLITILSFRDDKKALSNKLKYL